ncbi:hypothetical protein [Halovivax gelatinilyticus]|uniref:hypothetical protein n=1 Tax=Halovivax gelatinilyticus TaxID=2961597 RepID=UPI0020CA5AD6|nr:hypothetical protein [Halovivax gelatinilyticus]
MTVCTISFAGCSSYFEDDPPDPTDVLRKFFEALNEGEIEAAKGLCHPDSPIELGEIELAVYESHSVSRPRTIWYEPDGTPREDLDEEAVPNDVLDSDDRTWVGAFLDIPERNFFSYGVFEFRRLEDEWLLYDEVSGNADALAIEPFPELDRTDA